MKKVSLLAAVILAVCTASFATSISSIKGYYNFYVSGVKDQYGYYVGGTFYSVSGNCPTNQHCDNYSFPAVTYGVLYFDGLGHAKFESVGNVNNSGGPTVGSVWSYTVSGYNGALSGSGGSAYLTLGNFNSAGVAQTLTIRTSDKNPNMGVATLQ